MFDRNSIPIALCILALLLVGQFIINRYAQQGTYYDDSSYGGDTYEYTSGDTYSYDGPANSKP